MASTLSRRLRDFVLSLFSLGFVLACLAMLNESVREYLVDALHGDFSALAPGSHVHAIAKHIAGMVPSLHPTLAIFAAAALALTIIMFRV